MRKCLVLFAILLLTDQLTKRLLPTPSWGWHHGTPLWQPYLLGCIALLVLLAYPPSRIAATVMGAGLVGNLISSGFGVVANPFVYGWTAFNFADVCLFAGYVLLPLSIPWVYLDMKHRLEWRTD